MWTDGLFYWAHICTILPLRPYRPARYSEQQSRWTEMMIVDIHAFIMASTVTRSQSNRAPLGCGGTRFTSWMCRRQICSNCVMLSWQYDQISEECFQHLVESVPRRIKTVLKEKGSNKVASVYGITKFSNAFTFPKILYWNYLWTCAFSLVKAGGKRIVKKSADDNANVQKETKKADKPR